MDQKTFLAAGILENIIDKEIQVQKLKVLWTR